MTAVLPRGRHEDGRAAVCALGANRTNGHRLTNADKRQAILMAIETDRRAQVGVNQSSVVVNRPLLHHNLVSNPPRPSHRQRREELPGHPKKPA